MVKLKLKVPSAGKPSKPNNEKKPSTVPKLKIKLPTAETTTGPKLKIKEPNATKKPKKSKDKVTKPKLKLSFGGTKPKATKLSKSDSIKLKLAPPSGKSSSSLTTSNSDAPKSIPKVRIKPTRVPGDGYDSEAPDVEDDPLLELGIVMRFLDDANLDLVHNAVESGDLSNISVKWITKDKAIVHVKDTLYLARLVDLPTLTEIFKTIDKKNIFKSIDVSQMLLVLRKVDPNNLSVERDFDLKSEFLFNHPLYSIPKTEIKQSRSVLRNGLLYPFEDVYRRFRYKRLDHRVLDDIQTKVDELIRLDDEAEEVHFEIVDVNSERHRVFDMGSGGGGVGVGVGVGGESGSGSGAPTPREGMFIQNQLASPLGRVEDGELKQSEGINGDGMLVDVDLEKELAKAFEVDDDDNDGREEGDEDENMGIEEEDEDDDDEDDDEDEDDEDEDDDGSNAKSGKQHAKLLEEEIADLEKVVEKHRIGLETATHKMMKMKFQLSYKTLKASLDGKKAELAKFLSDQNHQQGPKKSGQVEADGNEHGDEHEHDNESEVEGDNGGEGEDSDNIDDIDDLF